MYVNIRENIYLFIYKYRFPYYLDTFFHISYIYFIEIIILFHFLINYISTCKHKNRNSFYNQTM